MTTTKTLANLSPFLSEIILLQNLYSASSDSIIDPKTRQAIIKNQSIFFFKLAAALDNDHQIAHLQPAKLHSYANWGNSKSTTIIKKCSSSSFRRLIDNKVATLTEQAGLEIMIGARLKQHQR